MFNKKTKPVYLLALGIWALFATIPVFASDGSTIYENNFESDSSAAVIGGNKAIEFAVAGDPANDWLGVFQKDLYFEYANKINRGATMSFDLYLPQSASYTGLLKAQAVTKMGSSWSWTQAATIVDIGIGNFADQGNGYKKATVSIAFGAEIEATQGLKAIVPCLAASNCDYVGSIYLDNVKLADGAGAPPEPEFTTIYENNFESDSSAADIGGNKAMEFTVAGDPANDWLGIFQKDLYFEYTEKLNKGTTLSFDLYLPQSATYTGLLKAQAVTKMGSSWSWTQAATIVDIGIGNFADQGNGYKKASVSIAFGAEIEATQGLKAILPCLAASNCDYNGSIYLDNVKLVNASVPGEEPEVPVVDPIVFAFANASDISSWSDGGNYDYSGGIVIGYDSGLQAMKLDLDYSGNTSSSWSEAKVKHSFAQSLNLIGYNQFSFDFIYDPAKMTTGSFNAKISAGAIDASTTVKTPVDFGSGLKKSTVAITFASADNTISEFIVGLVGSTTDYKGPIYLDNVTFSQVSDGYVVATLTPEPQTRIAVDSGSIFANGITQPTSGSMKLVDENASDYTVKLAAYLEAVGRTDSVLFGHQNDTTFKTGIKSLSNSDTKDVTGSIAAVMGIDALSLTGNELAAAAWNDTLAKRVAAVEAVMKEAAGQGAIITLSAHMPNFELIDQRVKRSLAGTADPNDSNSVGILSDGHYNFSGYTPGISTGNIVSRIMPGQDLNYLYNDYLDMIAACAKSVEDDNISILFRPFHEGTGSWFWWGRAFCDQEAFKNLYKYTVTYLRDTKGVHNFLYSYGPSSDAQNTAEYALRYPGDDYVDMVGFDMYHSVPAVGDNFIPGLIAELAIVADFAAQHNKLFAVTETGVANGSQALLKTGNARKDWFNEVLDAVAPTTASYFLVWANFGESSSFYTPYVTSRTATKTKGHEMIDNFIDYYNDPRSVFANEMGDFTRIGVYAQDNTNVAGYIYSPVSGSRVLESVAIEAYATDVPDGAIVSFVAKNKTGVVVDIPAQEYANDIYKGTLTTDQLALLGKAAGTMSLVIGGTTYNTLNLKYNIPEPVVDPTIVDTFEDYEGDDDILNSKWSAEKGSGCNITASLSDKSHAGAYGLEFAYSLVSGGYIGVTKNMNGANWSSKNALELWTIPDGKKQKVVVQVTSGTNVFEVYLNLYTQYNAAQNPLLVTIPFSSFIGRDDKTAVFDATNIQKFGLWCNTIVPAGEDPSTYAFASVLYYDEIKAVTSSAATITFTEIIPNRSPVLGSIGNKSVDEGATLAFTVTASDPDGDTIALSAAGLPGGATFDATNGSFSWTPDFVGSGSYTVTFNANDGALSDSEEIAITVANVTASQYAEQMIDVIETMRLDKVTTRLLAIQLDITKALLAKNKLIPALVSVKTFALSVKLATGKAISVENAHILLKDACTLCGIITNDYSLTANEKINTLMKICREIKDDKCRITKGILEKSIDKLIKAIEKL